ncbi:toll/interleukin-1 receptor-like protein [Lotus japonicus]|uniref:toll/interleukin-1 receptor-like protein n=1 Tax=Lotus japonicus TaxID=34305 RepID=UPI00258D7463|nr:toll/interleukin-1 receptor-like protein [Lotus japonicus]
MANEGDHNGEPTWGYDVFICFRGEDTRYTFTGNLYNALCQKKVKTFMDDKGLKSGDHISSILKALENSRLITENMEKKNQLVFPIFYDVDPSVPLSHEGLKSYKLSSSRTKLQTVCKIKD